MVLPAAVVADGNLKVLWVPTIANPAAPTAAELNAGSVVDLSCYLTQFAPATNEAVVTDDRLCSRKTLENPGKETETLAITYVYNPLVPADNEAQLALIKGTVGNLVARWAAPFDDAVAADDIVDVWPVKAGRQVKQEGAANETLKIAQKMFVYDEVQTDVTVAA